MKVGTNFAKLGTVLPLQLKIVGDTFKTSPTERGTSFPEMAEVPAVVVKVSFAAPAPPHPPIFQPIHYPSPPMEDEALLGLTYF